LVAAQPHLCFLAHAVAKHWKPLVQLLTRISELP
jgi:hypothetical protein